MLEPIAIAVFVFVAFTVAGWRALDQLAAAKRERECARLARIIRQPGTRYSGPLFNRHGREIDA